MVNDQRQGKRPLAIVRYGAAILISGLAVYVIFDAIHWFVLGTKELFSTEFLTMRDFYFLRSSQCGAISGAVQSQPIYS
jgi:hypothetical protein